MKKVNDWWAIPAIIICIFVNAYGLSLVSAPILNLETRALSESKISQVIVARHLKIQESVYREKWIKKNGLVSTKSAQYQNWLSHNLKVTKNALEKEVSLATFERIKKNTFYEEFNIVQKKAIFSALGENTKHSFWYLFFKGLLLCFFSFLFFIILNRGKIDLNSGRLTDFEKILVKMPLSSLILAFVLHTIVFYRFTSINETSSIILFAVLFVSFLGYSLYWMIESFVINGFVYIADYLIILFNWITRMLDRVAYYWLKNRTDGDLLGENILDSFSKKNNFFIFHKNGVQKVIVDEYKENNIPIFCKSESPTFSFDKFFSVLIDDSLNDYFKRLNTKATRKFRNHFSLNGKEELIEYAENIAEKIKDKVEHKVNENSFIEGKYNHSQTEKLLAKILNKSLKSFRQKLILESRDSIQETTIGLRNLLYNEIRREDKKKNDDFCNASILPANTKFLLSKQNLNIFVIEQAPQRRTIKYRGCPYFLSFPYVVFIVSFADDTFETLHVFYSNKPLKSLSDTAYYSSFNNVSDDGMVCVGTVKDELQLMEGSLGRKADEAISAFWQSNFNTDIDDCFDRYENDLIDYGTWAEKSREQPDFFSTISLLECDSFRNIIDGMIDEEFSETSDFNRAKKLRGLIDSWFEANESNIREKVSKTWSNISLDEFSTKEVEDFMALRNVEIDNLLELVKNLCLDCVNDKSIPKDFSVKLIKSFEESVRRDFNPLLSSVPFKLNVSFSKMFNQINM